MISLFSRSQLSCIDNNMKLIVSNINLIFRFLNFLFLKVYVASVTLALVVNASHNTDNQNKSKRGVAEQSQIQGEQIGYKPLGLVQDHSAAVMHEIGNLFSSTSRPVTYVNTQLKGPYEAEQRVHAQIVYGYPSQEVQIPQPQVQYPQAIVPAPPQPIIYSPQPSPNNHVPFNAYQAQAPVHQQHQQIVHPAHYQTQVSAIHHLPQINHQQLHPQYTAPKYTIPNPRPYYNQAPQPIVQNSYAQPVQHTYQKAQLTTYKPKYTSHVTPSTYSFRQTHQPWKPIEQPARVENKNNQKEVKPVVEDDTEADDEDKHVNEEYNSEEHYEEDEPYHSARYHYDDDDSHEHYEEDEDEDNHRGSSKYRRLKPYKYQKTEYKPYKRYETNDKYKYKENYEKKSKNGKPVKSYYKSYEDSEPKSYYKYKKYPKSNSYKTKGDSFEGKHTENVPVVHNKKLFQEKWFVSKSHDTSQKN